MPPRVVPSAKPSPTSVSPILSPFWATKDGETVRLYLGNVTDVLSRMEEGSVQTVVTSPPYWGLRSYLKDDHEHKRYELGSEPSPDCGTSGQAQCGGCFVCAMVAVFRGVRRVLRDDGTLWLNLGDTYGGGKVGPTDLGRDVNGQKLGGRAEHIKSSSTSDLPPGNLVGIPWRVALALQADGWVLRQDVIWHKPSPMPESVRNRCTKAHEYVFLLTKSARYFYDAEAVRESARYGYSETTVGKFNGRDTYGEHNSRTIKPGEGGDRNKRSVWSVSSQGYEGAHFATFPPKLIEPCILAGTSARGRCSKCSAPWKRVTVDTPLTRERPNDYTKRMGEEGTGNSCANSVAGVEVKTVGWEPGCECFGSFEEREGTRMGYGSVHNHEGDGVEYGMRQSGEDRMLSGADLLAGKKVLTKIFKCKVREYVCSCGVRWAKSGTSPVGKDWNAKKRAEGTVGEKGQSKEDREDDEERLSLSTTPTVWRDDPCGCYGEESGRVLPCVVLDPFIGSGTSCVVSLEHGRWSWGIDLSETYLRNNAISRVEGYLLSVPSLAALAGRETKKVMIGKVMTIGKGKGG